MPADPVPSRLRRALSGTRMRLLAWYVVLLAAASVVSVVALREVLDARLEAQVEEDLRQEAEEFRQLVSGNDPRTGMPFGSDLRAVVDTYLRRNIPARREAVFTYVEGRPYLGSSNPRADLYERDDLTRRWTTLTATERGRTETPAGTAEHLAVPVLAGGRTAGTFVVVSFTDVPRREVADAVRLAGAVDLAVLALASAVAFAASGRVLAPLRRITDTARRIEEDDLSQRLEVRGSDELAELGRTFNAMLDRLETAFESQRQFAADAGHELRTPITIVRGHLEVMGDDPVDRRETVALVTDELDRMARLVDDLLLLARSQRPDFLQREQVDAGALVREAAAKALALGDRRWEVEEVAEVQVTADGQRLTQALLQLAANAVRHTGPEDVVSFGSSLEPDGLHLRVRDTGEGIPLEEQERLFDRFARGRGARGEGSGLGLAIVRAIVEGHGGRVAVRSAPGQGSVFTCVVPVPGRPA